VSSGPPTAAVPTIGGTGAAAGRQRGPVRLAVVFVVLLGMVGAGWGCDVRQVRTVEGLVTSVTSSSPSAVEGFTLRLEDGQVLDFVITGAIDLGDGGFPGSHLREHQALAQPVRVTFREEGTAGAVQRVVVRLEDA
jgi:hypothetical protein